MQLGKSFRNQNLLKPQLGFDHKPQNADNSPWKPLLTSKPHAIIPLEKSLGTFTNDFGHKQYVTRFFFSFSNISKDNNSLRSENAP